MAAQKGIDMLLKVSDDGTSSGTMGTLGGIRTNQISMGSTPIDVTSQDDTDRWRKLMTGGVREVSFSGSGVFVDDAAFEDLRGHLFATTESLAYLQCIVPDFGTFAGNFHISNLDVEGSHDGEVTFSASFASASAVTFVAA